MLYRVRLYTPSQYERCHEVTKTCVVGSKRAAELQAEAWLPTSNETYYSAKVSRLLYVEVHKVKHFRSGFMTNKEYREFGKPVACHDTPINYVPSVGELGYTP